MNSKIITSSELVAVLLNVLELLPKDLLKIIATYVKQVEGNFVDFIKNNDGKLIDIKYPKSIAFDDNYLYVNCDKRNIKIFDSNNENICRIDINKKRHEIYDSMLCHTIGIQNSCLYIPSTFKIKVFSVPSRTFLYDINCDYIWSGLVLCKSYIYICAINCIRIYTHCGTLIKKIGGEKIKDEEYYYFKFNCVTSIAIDDEMFYVLDISQRIYVFTKNWIYQDFWDISKHFTGSNIIGNSKITVFNDIIYINSSSEIICFNKKGDVVNRWGSDKLTKIVSYTFKEGRCYVADYDGNFIAIFE